MTRAQRAVLQSIASVLCVWLSIELGSLVDLQLPVAEPRSNEAKEVLIEGELRARPETVVRYEMDVSLDPDEHVVRGTQKIRFRNTSSAAVDELWVHLYLNAFENEGTVFFRGGQRDFRGGLGLTSEGSITVERFFVRELDEDIWPKHEFREANDRTDARLPLSRPLAPGAELNIDVAFTSRLPNVVLRTGHAGTFHMVGQWFPKLARLEPDGSWAHFPFHRLSEFYADFADWDVRLAVPLGYDVGATGETISDETRDGMRHLRFSLDGAIDFAFAAWDEFVRSETTTEGVKIITLHPKGYEEVARRQTEAARGGLRFYAKTFGRYPYPTLTIVHPPDAAEQAGGMEYPSLITTGGPRHQAWTRALSPELLTLHELAHQWFYGIVATNEHAHPFLDEGLTSYAADLCAAELYGEAQLLPPIRVSVPDGERLFARGELVRSIDSSASEFESGSEYGRLVYYRSATILHTIDRVFSGAARRAVVRYARENRFGHPNPAAFFAAFEPEARAVAEACFSRLCAPDLSVSEVGRTNDGAFATVFRHGEPALPVEVSLFFDDGTERRVRIDTRSAETTITVDGRASLRRVVVDPESRILIDGDLTNNARTTGDALGVTTVFLQGVVLSEVAAALGLP